MNTLKDNLEDKIRQQIEEREIAPSRDLWSEIELQKETANSKSNRSWLLAAACVVLAFGLWVILFSNSSEKNTTQNVEIAEVKEQPFQEKVSEKSTENRTSEPVYAEKNVIQKNKTVSAKVTSEIPQTPEVLAEQTKELPKKEEAQVIVPETPKVLAPAEKIMAQSKDTSKIPAKRKKYVDPATLLFSVEHKDVIEKTKESNVATVDLNGR
ncbi:hypothetical protein [Chryseobacterium sp. JUb7]|uniref:hypothetical protein n=1 Tax=Chryseobacterium sp. JUb7 TaxID=2940599 RepID=UPI002167FF39|nr:hypothetical protein [Chryseobacterium sp. JUb7]MCS3530404.1 tRNA G10 N-methylase Trm11 [Chryseobacterium sp. JUb7]